MKIKQILENFVSQKNLSGLASYVRSNNSEIYEIYCKEGSGSKSLLSAYEMICITDPSTALEYQNIMETSIAGDVLFSNE